MLRHLLAVTLLSLIVASCNTVNGTIDSTSFGTVAGVAVVAGDSVEIILTTDLSECSDLMKSAFRANTRSLTLTLEETGATVQAVLPSTGEFTVRNEEGPTTIPPNDRAVAPLFVSLNASCDVTDMEAATSGSVQVTAIDLSPGGSIAGTFDVTFPSGHLTGTFSAALCKPGGSSGSSGIDNDQESYEVTCE